MKKLNFLFILTALLALPAFVSAQWNHVRFDQVNSFHKVYAVSANDVFVLGASGSTGEYFMVRSNDGGQTWDSINFNNASTYQLTELYFKDAVNGFSGGYKNGATQALLKTTDNATTWTEITPDPSSTEPIIAVYFVSPSNGFAASASALYSTVNGGASWTTQPMSFTANDLTFSNMNDGYASGRSTSGTALLMKTTNGGQTWTPVLSVGNPNLWVNSFEKQDVLGSGVMFTAGTYTNMLYKTLDGGLTWDTIVVDSVQSIYDFQFTTALLGHVLSNYGQIYVTHDGGLTWALEYATEWGLYGPSIYFYSISFVEETGYVVGTSGLIKKHEITNAIPETAATSDLIIYPNPLTASQNLSIELAGISGESKIQIMNAHGQLVYSKTINIAQHVISIPGLNLPAGVYSLSVETTTTRSTQKLMIVE